MPDLFKTPIVFLTFNRPHLTQRVFEEIRKRRPQKLFWVADGPRTHVPEDKEKCAQVRALSEKIDWDCEIFRDFSDRNLGLRKRVSSGISRAFQKIEKAIILEDDCLPTEDFFYFCEQILEKYQGNPRVMAVSGNHFLPDTFPLAAPYYFLRIPLIWGWATWRRAWKFYPENDVDIKKLLKLTSNSISFSCRAERAFFKTKIKAILSGHLDTWDYLWSVILKKNKGLCACPSSNLVANIGFGSDASNCFGEAKAIFSRTRALTLPLQIQNPIKIETDIQKDLYIFRNYIVIPLWQRIKDRIAVFIFYRFFKKKLKFLLERRKSRSISIAK